MLQFSFPTLILLNFILSEITWKRITTFKTISIINATCCVPTIHAFGSYNDSGVIEYPQPELIEVNSVIDYEGEELEISQELEDLIIKTFGVWNISGK